MTRCKLDEDIKLYYDTGYSKIRFLWELIGNSDRVINSVYLLKNFDEYCRQLQSNKQEDKQEIYWNTAYNEKLIDYIKIIVAFETLNKALLIKNGILIHKIDGKFNRQLQKKQEKGNPIEINEFFQNNYTNIDLIRRKAELNGLLKNLSTISFSQTLNNEYQSILKLDKSLVLHLKDINIKRNRLHLYLDFNGAYTIQRHIEKWKFIKEISFSTIRNELLKIEEELKNCV